MPDVHLVARRPPRPVAPRVRERTLAVCAVMGALGLGLVGVCASSSAATGVSASARAAHAKSKAKGHAKPKTFIEGLHTIKTIASTIPANGDVDPYALLVVPSSWGKLVKGNLLVDSFNDKGNDQGTGSTIGQITTKGKMSLFTQISRTLAGCPGGVGLTTAMTVLGNGDVIVGSTPSTDGTTKTAGAGCLIVLSPEGQVLGTIAGANIDGPWDMTRAVS